MLKEPNAREMNVRANLRPSLHTNATSSFADVNDVKADKETGEYHEPH